MAVKYDVISFGSAVLDVFVKSSEAKIVRAKEAGTGQVLAFPYGTKCEAERLVVCSGGGGTNTAVGFTRLGLRAAVVARCGWNFAGKIIRREIKREGVDDSFLVQVEKEETDYSTILVGPDNGRTILVYRGGTRLEKLVIDFKKLQAKWFYSSSLEGNLDLLAKIISHAKQNNIKTVANPGRREINQKDSLLKIARGLDVLVVNYQEAAELAGLLSTDPKVPAKLYALLPQTVIAITRGLKGAVIRHPRQGVFQARGLKVKTSDSTGAGDAFGVGLVYGLIRKWSLEKALRLAIANGAAAVTKIGSKSGLIKEKEIGLWLGKPVKIKKTE